MATEPKKRKIPVFVYYIILITVVILITQLLIPSLTAPKTKEITYDQFLTMLEEGTVDKVELDKAKNKITVKPKDFKESNTYYYTGILAISDEELAGKLKEAGISYSSPIAEEATFLDYFLAYILPIIGSCLVLFIVFRIMTKKMGGGVMSFGKNTSKIYGEKSTGKTFADVAGQDEAKQSLMEILDFLKNPQKYSEIGAKLPKGALLVGPPGTGKTLLAKAVAGEAGIPFFSISGSEFVEMFVGMGASRVRDLFKQALENAPCIVFIDEIDAIGKSRDASFTSNDEREQTLNQLLSEMDGFNSAKGVIILAATNRPEVLDKALLRPGRFDRRIIVNLPDQEGRTDILKVHAKNVKLESDVDFELISRATAGASGADLENIINEAALHAVRKGKKTVSQKELDEAVEIILAGEEKKNNIMSDEEKKIVAYHETGHALVSALLEKTEPVHKITIIPRTSGTLGYVLQVSKKEKVLMSREDLLNQIKIFSGGRAAEDIIFNFITTGASNDIEKATEIARAMVTQYGMSGKIGFINIEKKNSIYLLDSTSSNCSESTSAEVDAEIRSIVTACYNEAHDILTNHRDTLEAIANVLLSKENITGEEFMELLKQYEPDIANEIEGKNNEDKNTDADPESGN